jgi:hypothetical protein
MKNYTTRTAALKATTIDTRILDTKILKINGESLKDVILQTAPKGINNAFKISTTIGSIKNDSTVTSGDYQIGLVGGMLWVQRVDGISGYSWQPVQVVLNGDVVFSASEINQQGHWEMLLWDDSDDLTKIYGGLTDDSIVEILIVIHEVQDGDEPVQTSLTGEVQHNVVYHLGEEANLNLTLPTSLIANYAAEVVFTSGATPTVVTSDSRIKWVGDDVNTGVFTPVANVRYSCSLQYDGVFVRGMAFGIPTV